MGEKYSEGLMMSEKEIMRLEADWLYRGFSIASRELCYMGERLENFHGDDKLIVLLEGEVEIHMNGEVIKPKVGQEVLIPGRTIHSIVSKRPVLAKWIRGIANQGYYENRLAL